MSNALILKLSYEGELRRVRLSDKPTAYKLAEVHATIRSIFKLSSAPLALTYVDDDGDDIRVTSDIEFLEAIRFMQKQADGTPVVRLTVTCDGDIEMSEIPASSSCSSSSLPAAEPVSVPVPVAVPVAAVPVAVSSPALAPSAAPVDVPAVDSRGKGRGVEDDEDEHEEGMVPLSEVVDEKVSQHPFFVRMWTDFRDFTRNVRGSIPADFSDQVRTQLEEGATNVRGSVNEFVTALEARRKVFVNENWRENSFFQRVRQIVADGRENVNDRLARWEAARKHLSEIGFTESPMVQNLLIIQYDGDVGKIVDDLLNNQDRNGKVEAAFQRFTTSLLELFRNARRIAKVRFEQGVRDFNRLGTSVTAGLNSGGEFVQRQLENNQKHLTTLQTHVDSAVTVLNRAGEATASNVQSGIDNMNKDAREALEHTVGLLRSAEASLGTAGNNVRNNGASMISQALRNLHDILFRMSLSIDRDINSSSSSSSQPTAVCSACQKSIAGARFRCGVCADYTLCVACEERFVELHDPAHVLLKIRDTTRVDVTVDAIANAAAAQAAPAAAETAKVESEDEESEEESEEEEEEEKVNEEVEQEVSEFENIQTEPPAPPADPRLAPALETLAQMGFSDQETNTALLAAYNYDVETVLENLLRAGQ